MTLGADSSRDTQINKICDGFGCDEKATGKMNVDAGKFGTLTLFLCKNCVRKFKDD
jgi:hypothetical protein